MTANRRITSTIKIPLLAVLAVCLYLLPSLADAQNFERYRPKLPSNLEGESKLPDEPAEAIGDPTVLVDELKAVIFVDHQDKVVQGALEASGVQVRSETGLEMLRTLTFQSVVKPYLGEPISLLRLNELVRDVIIFYRTNDQPVVDVSIPEQDVTDGVVQIVVTEGRIAGKAAVRYVNDLGNDRPRVDETEVEGLKTIVYQPDRKSTRLNSSHVVISYAVFCLKKKKTSME